MLTGRMMDFPLTVTHLLERVRTFFPGVQVVSRRGDRSLERRTYKDIYTRGVRLAAALAKLGVGPGDRVATLCWNHGEHLEAYLAVPAMGAVLHTLNLRLAPSEIGYIANHAKDRVLLVDKSLLPLYAKFRADVPSLEHVFVLDGKEEGLGHYESLIANSDPSGFTFPKLDENTAAMLCYTSGTTGKAKGVLYSHRSTVLHALVACMRDNLGIGEDDVVLPVVPMFHAAAWGLPYEAAATGAKLVFPGPHLDPESILDLIERERVTFAGGVPTIWIGILDRLDRERGRWDLSSLRRMIVGGAAAPPAMIDGFAKRHGIEVIHAWGMTEMNPLGTLARVKAGMGTISEQRHLAYRSSQGYPVVFVEQRHVSDDGAVLPWDNASMGELEVRGPWVASTYFGDEGADRFTNDGWFKTGDVVTICPEGYVRICDRSKDVIKSGGEWISSVALESALMAHPAVLEAAVFAATHPKWSERPVAAVVFREGMRASEDELATHLAATFPKYWLPDAYVVLPQIPRTSTGKFLKTKLRDDFGSILEKQEERLTAPP
ncbi:long-chain fatty acid--CoA ligase [Pendulispora albinea]|uniref:Long-chain fatty acid--CoA ligase n=2 Tax=Pendulispora albinea TaxID=2741071 RepID=A0ABZ2MCS1_9BACT